MKRTILIGATTLLLMASCSSKKTLYNWDNYENVSYNYSKDPSDKNLSELDKCFAKMTEKQTGTRQVLPPGVLAERAYILIKQGKKEQAIEMLNNEIKLYPESKPFIDKILKQLEDK